MNWGILGCADIAERMVIPAILSITENRLVAIASRNLSKAEILAAKFNCDAIEGYDNLINREDIDAIYIPLPISLHYDSVLKSARKKKHILVEKSTACSYKEAEVMVCHARKENVVLMENFQFLHHSQHKYVKDMLRNGLIGDVRCIRSSFGFPPFSVNSNIRYRKDLGGGALLDAGAYVLRINTFLFGDDFKVHASFLKYHDTFEVDWYGGAFLTNNEKNLLSEVAFGFDNYYQCNYEIWGSNGKITSTRAFTAKPDHVPVVILERGNETEKIILPLDDHFRNILLYFNRCVESKEYEIEYNNILTQSRLIEDVRSKRAL